MLTVPHNLDRGLETGNHFSSMGAGASADVADLSPSDIAAAFAAMPEDTKKKVLVAVSGVELPTKLYYWGIKVSKLTIRFSKDLAKTIL